MKDREQHRATLSSMVRAMCEDMKSDQHKKNLKMIGTLLFRAPLGGVLHPIASIRTTLIIGNKETQEKDWAALRKTPYPSFLRPRGGQKT